MFNSATQKCATVDDLVPKPVDNKYIVYINRPRHSDPGIQTRMMVKLSQALDNSITYEYTLLENHPKCLIWIFQLWHFPPIFVLSGNTVWQQASRFQKLAKLSVIDIFNELLSTQNINVVRSQYWMIFFCEFQTPCGIWISFNDFQTLCFTKV